MATELRSNDIKTFYGGRRMINNSSLDKWNRLRQKDINNQFRNEVISGLNCSPFEAGAVLDTVYKVFSHYFETCGSIKHGQILFQIVSKENGPSISLADCKQLTVLLTLDAGQEDLRIKEKHGITALRRHRIERVCHEAFQQGGLLTIEDLASRLFNCGERTLSRDLAYFRENDIFIPLRSTVKDMGRTISHRVQIVKQWLLGKEYTEVGRNTCHSISAVRNYVDKFKRVIALYKDDFEINSIAFIAKVSSAIITEYIKIYKEADIIEHRKNEIESFLKKNRADSCSAESGGSYD
jgi:hypothetical protein